LVATPVREIPCPASLLPDFHSREKTAKASYPDSATFQPRENPRPACLLREIASSPCTNSGHPPVDALHFIENTHLTDAAFSLTNFLEGVQQDRSLTVS
jgi:hypothetical protein